MCKKKVSLKCLKVIEKAQNGNPLETTELGFQEPKLIFKSQVFTYFHSPFSCTVTLLSYTPPCWSPNKTLSKRKMQAFSAH